VKEDGRAAAASSAVAGVESACRIVELEAACEALRARNRLLEAIIDNSPTVIYAKDLDGRFLLINRRFEELFHVGRGAVLGKTDHDLFPKERADAYRAVDLQVKASGVRLEAEELAVLDNGLHAFISVKSPLFDERGEMYCVCGISTDITQRKRIEEQLLRERRLFIGGPCVVFRWVAEPRWPVEYVSPNAEGLFGYTAQEFMSGTVPYVSVVHPDDLERVAAEVKGFSDAGVPCFEQEYRIKVPSGAVRWLHCFTVVARDETGKITHYDGYVMDATDRKAAEYALRRSEEQLRQAQKMEAIGSFAGGIAHDFNNLLSIIVSYSSLLATSMTPSDPRRTDLHEITAAGVRAGELTKQLLAFGRQQILQPRTVSLSDIVLRMEPMLRRLIGEDIELSVRTDPAEGTVKADAGQIEQIIMSLAVNSRDAMPGGGKLTLEILNVDLDVSYAAEHVGVIPGPHVMLAVSDTGIGMDKGTQARMLEPFSTAKEQGKSTGLRLATVFGIVQQSGGNVWMYSEPGNGTTVKVHFPRADAATADVHEPVVPTGGPLVGTETILLVEDDQRVRTLARIILERSGYHVLEAQSGGDALLICEQHGTTIDLLLTDVIMPRMNGQQLSERLQPLRPAMKVLFMSGYTDHSIIDRAILKSGVALLQKPITPETLTRKVREVLDKV
jgi:PAS domain S-box-containing protein